MSSVKSERFVMRINGKDDGSTFGGLVFAGCILIAFCAGYTLRDRGVRLQAVQEDPPIIRQP